MKSEINSARTSTRSASSFQQTATPQIIGRKLFPGQVHKPDIGVPGQCTQCYRGPQRTAVAVTLSSAPVVTRWPVFQTYLLPPRCRCDRPRSLWEVVFRRHAGFRAAWQAGLLCAMLRNRKSLPFGLNSEPRIALFQVVDHVFQIMVRLKTILFDKATADTGLWQNHRIDPGKIRSLYGTAPRSPRDRTQSAVARRFSQVVQADFANRSQANRACHFPQPAPSPAVRSHDAPADSCSTPDNDPASVAWLHAAIGNRMRPPEHHLRGRSIDVDTVAKLRLKIQVARLQKVIKQRRRIIGLAGNIARRQKRLCPHFLIPKWQPVFAIYQKTPRLLGPRSIARIDPVWLSVPVLGGPDQKLDPATAQRLPNQVCLLFRQLAQLRRKSKNGVRFLTVYKLNRSRPHKDREVLTRGIWNGKPRLFQKSPAALFVRRQSRQRAVRMRRKDRNPRQSHNTADADPRALPHWLATRLLRFRFGPIDRAQLDVVIGGKLDPA